MSVAYPCADGYCRPGDVIARIKAGNYDPDKPGGIGMAYIDQFITQAAAEIDMVLARAGYSAPPVALPNTTIGDQVYTMLLNINATYAAGLVEMWRHSTDASGQDSQAERLLSLADDMLERIANDDVNLALPPFNCAGPFEPTADPSQAMDSPTQDPDPITGIPSSPMFTSVPNQGTDQTNPLVIW